MAKGGPGAPLDNRKGDVAVVLDLATANATYKKKLFRCAPIVKSMAGEGKLKKWSSLSRWPLIWTPV